MALEQQETDEYGHTGYAVVIVMPENVKDDVANVRDQLAIPIHMIPAHVTVKGTFVQPRSLDEIRDIIESISKETAPFAIELEGQLLWGRQGARTLVISAKSSPELDGLHYKLFDAIEPVTTNAYGRESAHGFRFHMTVYQEVDEANHGKGQVLADGLILPKSMEAQSVCLMGTVGPRGRGGKWKVVQEYQFSLVWRA